MRARALPVGDNGFDPGSFRLIMVHRFRPDEVSRWGIAILPIFTKIEEKQNNLQRGFTQNSSPMNLFWRRYSTSTSMGVLGNIHK